ncbi:type-F conjugative transfer system protein TrbI [Enterobacter huaxiensis]|uniref:type-F conjugative transfer system protein TrbI n=1 Tax=Enterobacter huaxiensis TaxID=2494702 RepID=UPI002175A43F|nr:type-F conjugative transfer system protein TrbI [Enterobacter huaxiensis]MCS5452312.1 type-F conjugative transfer system protein TrbI [Enterobacter huaxiensis]
MSEMTESVNDSVSAKAKAPLTRRQKAKRQCLRNLGLVVLAVTALNAAVTSLMVAWHSPVTVSFDMKATVDQFTEQATEKGYDEAEMGLMTNRFTFSLNRALEDYQREHDATILVRAAVVSGVPDITDEIQHDIGRRMAEWP